jgi:hypothetical protein
VRFVCRCFFLRVRAPRNSDGVDLCARVHAETVASAGSASFLLSPELRSPPKAGPSDRPSATRKLKPIRRRASPKRFSFADSLDVSHRPSAGEWSSQVTVKKKALKDGNTFIREAGHQTLPHLPGDSALEMGSTASSFSYQRATTAHGIPRSISCPPIVARGCVLFLALCRAGCCNPA